MQNVTLGPADPEMVNYFELREMLHIRTRSPVTMVDILEDVTMK